MTETFIIQAMAVTLMALSMLMLCLLALCAVFAKDITRFSTMMERMMKSLKVFALGTSAALLIAFALRLLAPVIQNQDPQFYLGLMFGALGVLVLYVIAALIVITAVQRKS